jgi:hypothetical protein
LNPALTDQYVPRGQQFPIGLVVAFVTLVMRCATSLRGAASVLGLFGPTIGHGDLVPHWLTGRSWLLRIGLAALLRSKPAAPDWVWMIDHSIQIGQCKVLVILGVRLSDMPVGRALCHEDMELIALEPMINSTKVSVAQCLDETAGQVGVPRAIVDDHGADLHGGAEIFRQSHPETIELYDIKHKAACLLKARLENDERWKGFASQAAQTKCAIQQTELAFLVPPSQRTKARFMNLSELVDWGQGTLRLVDDPSRLERCDVSAERIRAKLGWLSEFREALTEWSGYHTVIKSTLDFVRCGGLYVGVEPDLAAAVPAPGGLADELREELIQFVTTESSKARIGERLPGTTEVLESCFGKVKELEDSQSKSGFTGLVLSLGAMVSKWDVDTIREALERVRVRDVLDWCRRKLGISVQSKRAKAFRDQVLAGATETG